MTEGELKQFLTACGLPAFVIRDDVSIFAQRLVQAEMVGKSSWSELVIPNDAKRHGRAMIIAIQVSSGFDVFGLDEVEGQPDGASESIVYMFENGPIHIGNFVPGGHAFLENKFGQRLSLEQGQDFSAVLASLAFMLSLINQPRLLRRDPFLSRQQRRAAQRGGAKAVDAWHQVTWDISKETAAKVSADPSYHKVPLHWRRGHFRRAEAHYKGAIQRPDALRPEERDLWWQWIEGQWVGHPAFGIKQSLHAPKLSTGELAR